MFSGITLSSSLESLASFASKCPVNHSEKMGQYYLAQIPGPNTWNRHLEQTALRCVIFRLSYLAMCQESDSLGMFWSINIIGYTILSS